MAGKLPPGTLKRNVLTHPKFADQALLCHVPWKTYGGVELYVSDRNQILNSKDLLSDNHLEAFQQLLKATFPAADLFQPILYFAVKGKSLEDRLKSLHVLRNRPWAQRGRKSQILFVNNIHWVTVSNRHSGPENHIVVYDSMGMDQDENFQHIVAAVFRFEDISEFDVCWVKTKRQDDGSSCGVYCAAFQTSICYDQEPDKLAFEHRVSGTS